MSLTKTLPATLPAAHRDFIHRAIERLARDERIIGVAAAGSFADDAMDAFSDLDLVIAIDPASFTQILHERHAIAAELGQLLAGFTGEHVGEPRVLICLYGAPVLHVDLKFVALPDAAQRVDQPVVLWERDGQLTSVLAVGEGRYPMPDPQWIEDRFWVWVHYCATRIGRGEHFEALDFLAFLRTTVLGPLGLHARGLRPVGLRRIEQHAPDFARELRATIATSEAESLIAATRTVIAIYRHLREQQQAPIERRQQAEAIAVEYLEELGNRGSRKRE